MTVAALIHGAPLGAGGLGLQATSALAGLTRSFRTHALGPGEGAEAISSPFSPRFIRYSPYRWLTGALQLRGDRSIGRRAAERLDSISPGLVYAFTQVGRESL